MKLSFVAVLSTLALCPSPSHAAMATGTITITNLAPFNGTWQSPVLAMIHDGSFDIYNMSEPASMQVERMAEDGNASPMIELFSSTQGALCFGLVGKSAIPPDGGIAELDFEFEYENGTSYYFSYITKILPSNDAWLANDDPLAYPVIDAEGAFIDLSIVDDGDDALTAETEVSDEIPEHTYFLNQGELDAGVPIVGGVILDHRGFAPAIDGGILSYPEYADADFKVEGYELIGIEVTIMPADESTNVPPACLTIVDIVCDSVNFESLCDVIHAAGLDDELAGGTWTLFAPTDQAFAEIPSESLQSILDDAEASTELISYHAVEGQALSASDLPCVPGENLVTMANGKSTRTLCENDTPKYQKGNENSADNLPMIILADVETCNGIIHIVDSVLLI